MRRFMCLLCLLLLFGCDKSELSAEQVQSYFSEMESLSCTLQINYHFAQSILDYTLDYDYNKRSEDQFTVIAPDSIAGIGGTISGDGTGTFQLRYEDAVLDDAAPVRAGLTPIDAFPGLLAELRQNVPTACWAERADGTSYTVLRYEGEDAIGPYAKQIWLADQLPRYAELYDATNCILTMQINPND